MESSNYFACLKYIEKYWEKIIFFNPRSHLFYPHASLISKFGQIGLPKRAISPNDTYFAKTQFYWDSYFIILGLVVSGKIDIAREMVENLVFLFEKYGLILARNCLFSLGRTQPPFLTQMAFEVFNHQSKPDISWLERIILTAKEEYRKVWFSGKRYCPEFGLSRYYPTFLPQIFTAYESGWDLSTRFAKQGPNLIPIDLNSCLYQYESDFVHLAQLQGDKREKDFWEKCLQERKKKIDFLLWDEVEGFYFDYNLKRKSRQPLRTLAGFYPLWTKMASQAQAAACRQNLKYFESSGGLTNTEKVEWKERQWDWPNGWPNQQYIVIKGLLNYGFLEEAEKLAQKWLNLNKEIFEKTGRFWEKYDVVNRQIGLSGLYPTQSGFAWTSAVFLRLLDEFS